MIQARVQSQKARLYPVRDPWHGKLGLQGDFQRVNAAAAVRAVEVLRKRGFSISDRAVREGLKASDWPGRMEIFKRAIAGGADLLLDGAHNPASMEALVRNLESLYPRRAHLVIFGTSRDKNSFQMLKTLGTLFKNVILCRNPNPRSQEIEILISHARPWFQGIFPAAHVSEALELAGRLSRPRDLVAATGSFYLIGEIRKKIKHA